MVGKERPEVRGYLLVYVDDMMVVADPQYLDDAIGAITGKWKCSQPDKLEVDGPSVRFCGFEMSLKKDGLRLSQQGYLETMLEKRGVQGVESQPLPKIHAGGRGDGRLQHGGPTKNSGSGWRSLVDVDTDETRHQFCCWGVRQDASQETEVCLDAGAAFTAISQPDENAGFVVRSMSRR